MSPVTKSKVRGPLAPYAEHFRKELDERGYTAGSREQHLWWIGRLSSWLATEGLELALLDEQTVLHFLEVEETGRRRMPTVRLFEPLFSWLRQHRLVPPEPSPALSPLEALLARYERWLTKERGLMARTVDRYVATAGRFLEGRRAPADELGVDGLTGKDVTLFLLADIGGGLSIAGAKGRVAEMRAVLRFLHIEGKIPTPLGEAIPPVGGWRGAAVPAAVPASDVRAMLKSCDRRTRIGLRDFAILTVLARLGLRASEIAGLEFEDIDWRLGEISVRGKGRRTERLPLPTDVGEAVAAYLTKGRPPAECRTVFVSHYAPRRPLNPNTVSAAVRNACRRAGLVPVPSHRLRHTLAREMLRQGVALPDISQVLRHRDLATTALYAKVDLASLRQVAEPWPGSSR